jgi:hypothetical protein
MFLRTEASKILLPPYPQTVRAARSHCIKWVPCLFFGVVGDMHTTVRKRSPKISGGSSDFSLLKKKISTVPWLFRAFLLHFDFWFSKSFARSIFLVLGRTCTLRRPHGVPKSAQHGPPNLSKFLLLQSQFFLIFPKIALKRSARRAFWTPGPPKSAPRSARGCP